MINLGNFKTLKTLVKLILNFTRNHTITYTKWLQIKVSAQKQEKSLWWRSKFYICLRKNIDFDLNHCSSNVYLGEFFFFALYLLYTQYVWFFLSDIRTGLFFLHNIQKICQMPKKKYIFNSSTSYVNEISRYEKLKIEIYSLKFNFLTYQPGSHTIDIPWRQLKIKLPGKHKEWVVKSFRKKEVTLTDCYRKNFG
jgi:hypothetical protein